MKYSMFSWFGYFMPFEERIAAIAAAGFDEVMVSWEDECEPYALKKEAFPELIRESGLGITNTHAPFIGYSTIWEKSKEENRTLLDELKGFVADAGRFDIPAMVVHTSDLDLQPDYSLENGYAFFSELAEAGERYGVNIAVENVSRQFLLTYLLDRIKTPHFGMCYDSSHDYMLHCGRGRILEDYRHRIKALHLSDNDLHIDRHWVPTEGEIPFDQVMTALCDVPLSVLSAEVVANKKWQAERPEAFCLAVYQGLKRLNAMREAAEKK